LFWGLEWRIGGEIVSGFLLVFVYGDSRGIFSFGVWFFGQSFFAG